MNQSSVNVKKLLGHQLNDVEEKYAPNILYYKGIANIPLTSARISIIGSRQASKNGLLEAKEITKILVKNNVTIISGLAKGIDTMAHQTAIKNGGKTIAVIGTPLNKTYPKENIKLQEEIMNNHLVISQFPIGHNTKPYDFVLRNRTMSLISDATIIVEAGETSGSLYQGWETLRLGKSLFICKSIVNDPKLKWTKKMLEYGAILLDEYIDVLESISPNIEMPKLFS